MAVKVDKLIRIFKFNGATFPDPDPNFSPEEVKDLISAAHPDLVTADISEPIHEGNRLIYSFVKAIGTKG